MYLIEGSSAVLSAVEKEYARKELTYERITPHFLLVFVDPLSVLKDNRTFCNLLAGGKLKIKKLHREEVTKIFDFGERVKVRDSKKRKKLVVIRKNRNGVIQEEVDFSRWKSAEDSLVGKKVKIVKGHLSGLKGIVQEVDSKNQMARVMLMVFNIPHVETVRLNELEILN